MLAGMISECGDFIAAFVSRFELPLRFAEKAAKTLQARYPRRTP